MTQAARHRAGADVAPVLTSDGRLTAALRAVEPPPFRPLDGAVLRDRMRGLRMSTVERQAAVDALLLGRGIGNALLRLGRALGGSTRRYAADRRTPPGAAQPARQAADSGADEWQAF